MRHHTPALLVQSAVDPQADTPRVDRSGFSAPRSSDQIHRLGTWRNWLPDLPLHDQQVVKNCHGRAATAGDSAMRWLRCSAQVEDARRSAPRPETCGAVSAACVVKWASRDPGWTAPADHRYSSRQPLRPPRLILPDRSSATRRGCRDGGQPVPRGGLRNSMAPAPQEAGHGLDVPVYPEDPGMETLPCREDESVICRITEPARPQYLRVGESGREAKSSSE